MELDVSAPKVIPDGNESTKGDKPFASPQIPRTREAFPLRIVRKRLIRGLKLGLDTLLPKAILITLVLAICGVLVYRMSWPFLAAWITRNGIATPDIYERAIRYDAKNAEYHFVLGKIYNYSTQYLNLSRAGEEYEAAVGLNPDRAAYWLELSKYYEQTRNVERSRYAMQMALRTDPNYAQTHWAAANLYIRMDDLKAADLELRRTADLDTSYLTKVLDLAWRFYEDPHKIMSTYVPNTMEANRLALDYFVSRESEEGASLAWNRLKMFDTKPQEHFGYINYLVSLNKPHEAWQVFRNGQNPSASLLYNGSFETEPLNGGFDWRFSSTEAAEARRDTTTSKDGRASFLVAFKGNENVNYARVWHWLPVHKGRSYELTFWMKTEGITTNEGIFVEVDGKSSEKQVGSTHWQQFTIPFKATSDLVTVSLRRVPSKKFDNLFAGKVWLDAFSLAEVGQ